MSYYNQTTTEERATLPDNIKTPSGFIAHPRPDQLESVGWLMAEVVPFVPASGYQKIPGTRTITVTDNVPYEEFQVETDAQAEARKAAEEEAYKEGVADYDTWLPREKVLCKLFVKEINKLRSNAGLPTYSKAQVKAALKNEV